MSTVRFFALSGLLLVSISLAVMSPSQLDPSSAQTAGRKAVVVELFTSEGCSSCPPADELLTNLGREHRKDGVEVIPLGLHVDYWNFQGWTDRFSSASYSARQAKYADHFRLQSPYTPQLVFDGVAESSGNGAADARALIQKAALRPALVEVKVALSADDKLQVNVSGPQNSRAEVMLALTEDNLSSRVGAGENNGRELRHSAVVHELRSLGTLHGNTFAATVPLKIKKDWKRKDLRAVIFVQEPGNGAIDGAASLPLSDQTASVR